MDNPAYLDQSVDLPEYAACTHTSQDNYKECPFHKACRSLFNEFCKLTKYGFIAKTFNYYLTT